MRHRLQAKRFSRSPSARKALFKQLVVSLVEHERIRTTLPKAKELRRHVERAVTIGCRADLAATRLLMSRYNHKDTVYKLTHDLCHRFKERPGGYTRIIKLSQRLGDGAPMAFIEFVDYTHERVQEQKFKVEARDGQRKKVIKEVGVGEKREFEKLRSQRVSKKAKKHLRRMRADSRVRNR